MFAHINNTKIFYDIDGQSIEVQGGNLVHKPVVFVIHGGPGGCHLTFKPYLDHLTKTAQLVYIDQRGCGFSEKGNPEEYTLTQNTDDIEALRQHLGLEKIWILGHSYGGIVAMDYAVKYGQNLAGLILAATSPSHKFLDKAKEHVEKHGNAEQIAMADILWEGKFETVEQLQEYDRVMAPLYSTIAAANTDKKAAPQRPAIKRNVQALNNGFGNFLQDLDLRDGLKVVDVPALILAGKHDWITSEAEGREIHQCLKNSELHVMENSSHNVFADENELTTSLIEAFLEKN